MTNAGISKYDSMTAKKYVRNFQVQPYIKKNNGEGKL